MSGKTLEQCKKQLEKSDRETLERRAERLNELAEIETNGRLFWSQMEWDYSGEAAQSYVVGNYRSAIFCCAGAVDQVFRYECLKMPGNRYEDLGTTFGQNIKKCRQKGIPSLVPLINKAQLLNRMRNEIAAHPLFIDVPTQSYEKTRVMSNMGILNLSSVPNLENSISWRDAFL